MKQTSKLNQDFDPTIPAATPVVVVDYYAIQLAVDSGDSTITYIGKAVTGSTTAAAVWQIKRMTDTSGDLSIEFADGDNLFDNVWNNREGLAYS